LKKKIIEDFYKLPNINTDKFYMKKKVEETIKNENFFKERVRAWKYSLNLISKTIPKPNKKVIDTKPVEEEKSISQIPLEDKSVSNFDTLEIGLIDKEPKSKNDSIFSCCNKIMLMFKK